MTRTDGYGDGEDYLYSFGFGYGCGDADGNGYGSGSSSADDEGNGIGFGIHYGFLSGDGRDTFIAGAGNNPSITPLLINDDPLTLACQAVTMFSYRG